MDDPLHKKCNLHYFTDVSAKFNSTNGLCARYTWWIKSKNDFKQCRGSIKRFMCHIRLVSDPFFCSLMNS